MTRDSLQGRLLGAVCSMATGIRGQVNDYLERKRFEQECEKTRRVRGSLNVHHDYHTIYAEYSRTSRINLRELRVGINSS